jgi:glucose-1-phosphate adenylyltransferase
MSNVLAFVLAGGEGARLRPLTEHRAKPAVPFGGRYRVVDFVLSNLVNSGIFKIKVLTQFKSDSLNKHLQKGWNLSAVLDHYIDLLPAQMRTSKDWYKGSADAVCQNLDQIRMEKPDLVLVVSADHIYRMDIQQFIQFHLTSDADATVSAIPVPLEEASSFGVVGVDEGWRMTSFFEKPAEPPAMPRDPHRALGSMGIYAFKPHVLVEALQGDARDEASAHDFGKNIIPFLHSSGAKVMVYNFSSNAYPGMTPAEAGYWRDVGSIDAYWRASMDLVSVTPVFNLYNNRWPIRTALYPHPPAKFVFADERSDRVGMATDSLVSEGCIISGGKINRSVLCPNVRINSFASVDECILFDSVNVGRHAKIRRAIVDKRVVIPPGTVIGYNSVEDRKKFFVSPDGIVVIPRDARLS